MIRMIFKNIIQSIVKNIVEAILLILLIASLLISLSGLFQKVVYASNNDEIVHNNINGKHIFLTKEVLDDITYSLYTRKGEKREDLDIFLHKLYASQTIDFVTQISHQGIEFRDNNIPTELLAGYEIGNADNSKVIRNEETYSRVKALYVSNKFFNVNPIKLKEGRFFINDDYYKKIEENIPIILGSDYEGTYKIGDIVSGTYFLEKCNYEVIGILDLDSFFLGKNGTDLESASRYAVVPALLDNREVDWYSILLLQEVVGQIWTEKDSIEVSCYFNELLAECGLADFGIEFVDENSNNYERRLTYYSEMTNEVTNQYIVLLSILVIFVILSLYFIFCERAQANIERYKIQILCGCRIEDIYLELVLQIIFIIIFADILSCLGIFFGLAETQNIDVFNALICMQLVAIAMIIILYILMRFHIKKWIFKGNLFSR